MKWYSINGAGWTEYVRGIKAVRQFLSERSLKLPKGCRVPINRCGCTETELVYFVYNSDKLYVTVTPCHH